MFHISERRFQPDLKIVSLRLTDPLDFAYATTQASIGCRLSMLSPLWATDHSKSIKNMIEHITEPLAALSGIEALQDQIVQAHNLVQRGLLRDPWEVEIILLGGGRVS